MIFAEVTPTTAEITLSQTLPFTSIRNRSGRKAFLPSFPLNFFEPASFFARPLFAGDHQIVGESSADRLI